MANETERLQVEFGMNDRWQAKDGRSYSGPLPAARYSNMKSCGVRVRSRASRQERERLASLRRRLDPRKY